MGANRALLALVCELRNTGKVIPTVVLPKEGEMTNELTKAGIKWQTIPFYVNFFGTKPTLKRRITAFCREFVTLYNAYHYRKSIKEERYDIIHSNSSATNFGAYLAKFVTTPHVWHLREVLVRHYNAKFGLGNRLQRKIFASMSEKLLCISNYVVRHFETFVPKKKIELVYDGIEQSMPTKVMSLTSTIEIAAVGLISPGKQQHLILEAVRMLIEQGVTGFCIHIIGELCENDSYCKSLIDYVDINNLHEYVKFDGYQSNVMDFISEMQIGILASRDEAFGLATLEYMYKGLCPVVLNSGASPELIKNNEVGLLFEDAPSLAEALRTLIINPELLQRHRDLAPKRAAEFSLEKNAVAVMDVYEKL